MPSREQQKTPAKDVMSKTVDNVPVVGEGFQKGTLSRECVNAIFGPSGTRRCDNLRCNACGELVAARRDETLIKHAMQK